MNSSQIEELRRLSESAPTLPWRSDFVESWRNRYEIRSCSGEFVCEVHARYPGKLNAAYIIAACNAVPELLKRIEELEDELQDAIHEKWELWGICNNGD